MKRRWTIAGDILVAALMMGGCIAVLHAQQPPPFVIPTQPAPFPYNYNTVAASSTAQALKGAANGLKGDYLDKCLVTPATTSPGIVTILDNATSIVIFAGGTVTSLVPFSVAIGAVSVSGPWKVTTGLNVSVVCTGYFN
jgi:hypothetical protein